jgi:hypothetical protein
LEVARIYNTGSFDLNVSVTCEWDNDTSNTITPTKQHIYLAPSQSSEVTLTVIGDELGNFTGKSYFTPKVMLPSNYTGNPTCPSGSANLKIHVTSSENPKPVTTNFDWTPIFMIMLVAVIGSGAFLGYKKIRRTHK